MRILIVEQSSSDSRPSQLSVLLHKYGICEVFQDHAPAFREYAEAFVRGTPYPLACIELEGDGVRAMNLMARMRKEEAKWNFPRCNIILVSEAVKPSVVKSAARLGCGAFLLKPIDPNLLMAKLDGMKIYPK
jgi:CheY-like chemotaxis protein